MKYKWIIATTLIIALLGVGSYFILKNHNEPINPTINIEKYTKITNESEIQKIIDESYLDILVQIKNYNNTTDHSKEILEAAMRIARENNLVKEISNNIYIEYVDEKDIHQIIFELTGKEVQNPLEFEDFYYLYNAENKYYYIIPIGTDWIHYKEIKNVEKNQTENTYQIKCDANLLYETEEIIYEELILTLKYIPNNTYAKYQLLNITQTNN